MPKRASGSRANKRRAARAASPAKARPAHEGTPEQVIAGEAANAIAKSAALGDANVVEVIEGHVAAPNQEPGRQERDAHTESSKAGMLIAVALGRRLFIATDNVELPLVRVVGRIVYILTVVGGKEWCTVTPIAAALLLSLREHLQPIHRQSGTTRAAIDVTEPNLSRLLYKRLDRLVSRKFELARKGPTVRGYQLTDYGQFLFKEWPEGIKFDPHDKDLWSKRAPHRVGRTSSAASPVKSL
jgi:hypothetical protein